MSAIRLTVPRPLRRALRVARERLRRRLMFGGLAPLVPPEELMHDGPPTYADFRANAEEFFRLYTGLGGLRPHERMLDVGCGIGRKTVRLTRYLNRRGSYEGIDIVKSGIDWCSRTISRRHPNFRFRHIDVFNRHYNPDGRQQAAGFKFPFADGSFDFVTLGSVFTHMLPKDTENYLGEVARVLRRGGRCLISWFLLDPDTDRLIRAGRSTLDFRHEVAGVCKCVNPADPEAAIGFDKAYVLDLYRRCGLTVREPVNSGSWSGRERCLSYQDLVLAFRA
jgi:SAM-dependent methyltransferase